MPDGPPMGYPPIALTIEYEREPARQIGETVAIRPPRLHLSSAVPNRYEGYAVGDATFRDIIFAARLSLVAGDDEDAYGVFVRQAEETAFYCFAASPAGRAIVSQYAVANYDVIDGDLAPDMRFNRGLNQPNVFQVVACGPNLTFILNGMVVTGVLVDPRYKEGNVGFYLRHGPTSARAELAVDWVQARAVLPDQP